MLFSSSTIPARSVLASVYMYFSLIWFYHQMGYEGRWAEARDALSGIAEEAIKYDSEGVDLCFLNSKRKCLAVKV